MADLKLTDLVVRVDQDKLVIPDFQRGFKWQTPDIRKLLESLLLDFPIGQHCCGARSERTWLSGASKTSSFQMARRMVRTILNRTDKKSRATRSTSSSTDSRESPRSISCSLPASRQVSTRT
jgi:hypothetical protein